MAGYGIVEKKVARLLENYPFIRTIIKETYKRVLYFRHKKKGVTVELADGVTIQSIKDFIHDTQSKNEYFFGYYDKSPWSPDMQKFLVHRKKPTETGVDILLIDLASGSFDVIGNTTAWAWQQGAMTQWVLGASDETCIYNAVENNVLGSYEYNCVTKTTTFIPWPVQSVHPTKRKHLSLNFRRLYELRRCYGYGMEVENFSPGMDYESDGIWGVDHITKSAELIISLARLRQENAKEGMAEARHKVNHCIYSPSGKAFIFLHRYINEQGKFSRLYAASEDGSKLTLLLDDRMVSHYHWVNDTHVIAWARTAAEGDRYYLIDAETGIGTIVGKDVLDLYGDGHCTGSPDGQWILTDTYPDKARFQTLLLVNRSTEKEQPVGAFFSPWKFIEDDRCDLHPRFSPDSKAISIDSAHTGTRQSYIVTVNHLVGKEK